VAIPVAALVAVVAIAVPIPVPGPVVAVLPVAVAGLAAFARLAGGRGRAAFSGGLVGGLGLGLGGLVLEVDVEAGGELVAAEDLGSGPLRLHGAQQAEIVLCVLQVILGQHPVAGRRGVAGELLVLFEHVLGVAPHLDAFGAVGIEGPV